MQSHSIPQLWHVNHICQPKKFPIASWEKRGNYGSPTWKTTPHNSKCFIFVLNNSYSPIVTLKWMDDTKRFKKNSFFCQSFNEFRLTNIKYRICHRNNAKIWIVKIKKNKKLSLTIYCHRSAAFRKFLEVEWGTYLDSMFRCRKNNFIFLVKFSLRHTILNKLFDTKTYAFSMIAPSRSTSTDLSFVLIDCFKAPIILISWFLFD